ncbi:hypothetical protein SAMN05880501_101136 [Ureibacillus xyleni]|uniref:Uncharacterized protein n=1 Tax=Ureibacillus xyleni TaxID=614648 RepID=A0A285RD45_9BACL|nr:hypothetical protein [Ureibacillus xyleni]SOB90297.1 hypothetical protein SAMN05880501_101136 [Ureibacillus xyleni]
MPIFVNPNNPEQPAKGVYRWYFHKEDDKQETVTTLYIGQAGKNKTNLLPRGTLYRGVGQVQRNPFYSGKGYTLDTNFIVGTIIHLLENKGYRCYWEHIDNDPSKEQMFVQKYKPIIQDQNGRLLTGYNMKLQNKWKKSMVQSAIEKVENKFTEDFV